jgi:hypothetical protein
MMVTYYRGLQNWPEREIVSNLTIPRLTFAGSNDTVMGVGGRRTPIGPLIAQHRDELERKLRPGDKVASRLNCYGRQKCDNSASRLIWG